MIMMIMNMIMFKYLFVNRNHTKHCDDWTLEGMRIPKIEYTTIQVYTLIMKYDYKRNFKNVQYAYSSFRT